jgi:anti-anti-sigma factor
MEQQSLEALQQEMARLRACVTELEADNASLKQSVAAHQQGEERLQSILESMTDNVLVWDGNYEYLYANQAAIDHVGTTRDQVIGKNIRDGLGHIPEFMQRWMQRIDHVLATNEPLYAEDVAEVGDRTVYSESRLAPLRGADNKPTAVALVYRDITERKQQEHDLRVLFDNVNDGIIIHTLDDTGTILEVNAQMMAMYQVDRATALSLKVSDFSSPDNNMEAIGQMLQRAIDGESPVFSWKARRPGDGSEFDAEVTLRRVQFQQQLCILATVRDITEHKKQQAEVSIFKTMADTAPDGFGMANADGTLTYANAAYRALAGYGDALIGMNFLDHFTEADRVLALEALKTTAEQGDWQGVLNFQHQDGSIIPVDTKGFVTRDEAGNIIAVMGLFRDLREQHRLEAERTAMQQQIIAAQRDALRELSTPLIPITEDVLIMPLIGTVDSQRAQMIMEALLEGVAQHQADLVILDITGVSVVDTQVAQAFIQSAQAVRLLGAQVMLTGIQPQIAQTLVHLGTDLSGIITRGSLQAGIATALRQ